MAESIENTDQRHNNKNTKEILDRLEEEAVSTSQSTNAENMSTITSEVEVVRDVLPAKTVEHVKPVEVHVQRPVIHRTREQTEIHRVIQPIVVPAGTDEQDGPQNPDISSLIPREEVKRRVIRSKSLTQLLDPIYLDVFTTHPNAEIAPSPADIQQAQLEAQLLQQIDTQRQQLKERRRSVRNVSFFSLILDIASAVIKVFLVYTLLLLNIVLLGGAYVMMGALRAFLRLLFPNTTTTTSSLQQPTTTTPSTTTTTTSTQQ